MAEISRLTPYRDLGNRRDVRGLSVLRRAKSPAVVVEVLSVTSPSERKALMNRHTQAEYAEAIVKGIARNHGLRYVPPRPPRALKKSPTRPAPKSPAAVETTRKPPAEFAADELAPPSEMGSGIAYTVPTRVRGRTAVNRNKRSAWLEALIGIFAG